MKNTLVPELPKTFTRVPSQLTNKHLLNPLATTFLALYHPRLLTLYFPTLLSHRLLTAPLMMLTNDTMPPTQPNSVPYLANFNGSLALPDQTFHTQQVFLASSVPTPANHTWMQSNTCVTTFSTHPHDASIIDPPVLSLMVFWKALLMRIGRPAVTLADLAVASLPHFNPVQWHGAAPDN